MKNMMTTMKTLAVAGMTMGLALGAKAELNNDCVTFTSKALFKLKNNKSQKAWDQNLYWSTDKTNWNVWDGAAISSAQTGGSGNYNLYLYGTGNTYFTGTGTINRADRWVFEVDGGNIVSASGNIETLRGAKGSEPSAVAMGESCYCSIFYNCTNLTSTLTLPATTLADACYNSMFFGCTSLTTAPELPAKTLANQCYSTIFSGCTSLTNAPALPAKTLADACYRGMFTGCTSLTTAPELPVTNLADSCYYSMFYKCTSLTNAPALPAKTLADNCYNGMFTSCTSLTTAPELPATNLATSCYSGMFTSCKSLTTAPTLPAKTLADNCYKEMFHSCASLTNAPALPVTTLADNCYIRMFVACKSLTTAPELPATNLADSCYSSMFYKCTSLTNAPALPAKTLADNCYNGMFTSCTSLTTVPTLPATTLAPSCYEEMFIYCSNLVVNTKGPGKAWSISSGAAVADNWNKNMFADTSGDLTSEPTIGTLYYVASAPVTLDVAAVDNATFQACTNGAPVDVPCTINYIIPVTVTYTATPGYAFPNGKAEFTTNVTMNAETVTVTLADDQKPIPNPPVEIEVSNPDGGKAAVYTNNVLVTGDTVLSNSIAYVVYTVTNGKFFENGETVVTNTLDTTTDPAKDKSAYVPTKTGTPTVKLGVVAQRYPWNGTLDIQYKTPYANATKTVTFSANGTVLGTATGTAGQEATASFDLNTVEGGAFKDKKLKSVKITATIE